MFTTMPQLGIYPDKTIILKDACTPMLITALFTISNTWKQPKCPSADEWIMKMWYVGRMEYYSAIKKKGIMPFAALWMDLVIIILCEVVQKEKDKYHVIFLNMESKIWHKWTYLWNRNRLSDIQHKVLVAKAVGVEEGWVVSLGLANANYYT